MDLNVDNDGSATGPDNDTCSWKTYADAGLTPSLDSLLVPPQQRPHRIHLGSEGSARKSRRHRVGRPQRQPLTCYMLVGLLITNAEDVMGQLTVGDVMTTAVLKVRPTTPFKELARVMAEHHVSARPVVDSDDQLVGVVSEADLLPKQELHGQRPAHRWALSGRHDFSERSTGDNAGQVMTTDLVTIGPGATLTEAAKL